MHFNVNIRPQRRVVVLQQWIRDSELNIHLVHTLSFVPAHFRSASCENVNFTSSDTITEN